MPQLLLPVHFERLRLRAHRATRTNDRRSRRDIQGAVRAPWTRPCGVAF